MQRTRSVWSVSLMAAVAAVFASADFVSARYRPVDIEQVPIDRLIANLEAARKATPRDVQPVLNLARLHAMAYSLRTDTVPVNKAAPQAVWFGYGMPWVPFNRVVPNGSLDSMSIAMAHLRRAIALYAIADSMAPGDLVTRIGYGWLLAQANRKQEAIPVLRGVVSNAWPRDQQVTGVFGAGPVTMEAISYLVPLLDKDRDRAEIDTLNGRLAYFNKLPRAVTPIAIPLADGLTATALEDRHASVAFDADGSDLPKRWTWITPKAAWLVHDPRGTGLVRSALQLFGSVSFWLLWRTGYDALSALDDNGDGELRGRALEGLALWHDANSNGVSDPGEVQSLAKHNIVALSTRFRRDARHVDRIAYSRAGVTFGDGRTRPTYDLILHSVE